MTTGRAAAGPGMPAFRRDPWMLLVGAVALAARAAYLVDLRDTPFFDHPQMDALFHDGWARSLASGAWWGSEVFFRAPLYPYFLGVLYALLGTDYLAVRIVQFALGTATALLTARFLHPRYGRVAAAVGGLLVALYGPLVYFEGELLLVVLEAPLNLVALWALQRAGERPTAGRWAAAGALLGPAALVRPIVLALPAVVGVHLVVRHRGAGGRRAALYAAGLLLVVSPVLVRNYVVGGDLVPVASQGGLNFYLGNHEGADGRAALAPEFRATWSGGLEDSKRLAEKAEGRPLRPSEVSRYWYGQAWTWASGNPGAFAAHQARKLGYFWDAFEIPNNQDYYFFSGLARVFRVPLLIGFGVVGPLALAGLALGIRRRRVSFAVAAVPAVLTAVVVAFFVCGRFRTALVPLFALWAGIGFAEAVRAIRARGRGDIALYLGVLAVVGWWSNSDPHGFRERHLPTESHLRLGVFHATRGDPASAERHYRRALELNPGFAEGWNNLGALYAGRGDLVRAGEAFERSLEAHPGYPKAVSNLAALAFRLGERSRADSLARVILGDPAAGPEALYNAGVVLGNLGDAAAALAAFDRMADLQPRNRDAALGRARAWVVLGDLPRARSILEAIPSSERTPAVKGLLESLPGGEGGQP